MPTDAQIAKLRRMVAEPTTDNDDDLRDYIALYPVRDSDHQPPFHEQVRDVELNPDWTPTYDLHAAAAAIWLEKAAALSSKFDHEVVESETSGAVTEYFVLLREERQLYNNAMSQYRHHAARRRVKSTRSEVGGNYGSIRYG